MLSQPDSYPPAPDYDVISREEWRLNAEDVKRKFRRKDPNIMQKIDAFIDRFGFDKTEISNKIENDVMFAAWFAKDPTRTSIHERVAASWLEKLSMIQSFETLKRSGKDALYVTSDGEIRYVAKKHNRSKSLDFRWKTNSFTVYASHKYTGQSGGAQDNQFRNVKEFLYRFREGGEIESSILLAIVDGDYYTPDRMIELRNLCRNMRPKSWALKIGDVPKWLEQNCK